MIRAVYSNEPINDLDSAMKGRTQIILLAALSNSERLDEAGLDAFLADARVTSRSLQSGNKS